MALFAIVCMLGVGIGSFCAGWILHEERDRSRHTIESQATARHRPIDGDGATT